MHARLLVGLFPACSYRKTAKITQYFSKGVTLNAIYAKPSKQHFWPFWTLKSKNQNFSETRLFIKKLKKRKVNKVSKGLSCKFSSSQNHYYILGTLGKFRNRKFCQIRVQQQIPLKWVTVKKQSEIPVLSQQDWERREKRCKFKGREFH